MRSFSIKSVFFVTCLFFILSNCTDKEYSSGELKDFLKSNLPKVATYSVINITVSTASVSGNLILIGLDSVTQRGHCWSNKPNPTINDSVTTLGGTTIVGIFNSTITCLNANTTYYVRTYATNSVGTAYGNEISFTTSSVTTTTITSITQTSASSGGNVTYKGSSSVTARGVCWSTTFNPTTSNCKTIDGSGTGSFSSSLTGLTANTLYYVRAYAINSVGTVYGNEVCFITTSFAIGIGYQGGIIAYILCPGDPGYVANTQHGIIAAPTDQSTGIQWYNGSYKVTNATATALGTGAANTAIIVAAQGAGSYAAKLCYDLVLGGYSDWYLPSKDELEKLYDNMYSIGGFAVYGNYWSSSEYTITGAWYFYFASGSPSYPSKYYTNYVRAVRAF